MFCILCCVFLRNLFWPDKIYGPRFCFIFQLNSPDSLHFLECTYSLSSLIIKFLLFSLFIILECWSSLYHSCVWEHDISRSHETGRHLSGVKWKNYRGKCWSLLLTLSITFILSVCFLLSLCVMEVIYVLDYTTILL